MRSSCRSQLRSTKGVSPSFSTWLRMRAGSAGLLWAVCTTSPSQEMLCVPSEIEMRAGMPGCNSSLTSMGNFLRSAVKRACKSRIWVWETRRQS